MARNPYHRLPWRLRSRILEFLREETPPEEIRSDPEIAAALAAKQLVLSDEAVEAVRRCREFQLYMEKAAMDADSRSAEKITAAVLDNSSSVGNITDSARYELAKLVRELLSDTSGLPDVPEKIKAVRSLAQCLSFLGASAWEHKLARRDAEILELKTEIARLLSESASLASELRLWKERANSANSTDVIREMNRSVGLDT